ncbi:hypothetical protein MTO96_025311 [Rhipicephalus appendiculatus]
MSPQELMRHAIEELGDPDELANYEDLIVLKLEPAFTNKWTLPDDIKLSDDARRLSMDQRSFIAHRALLGNLRYSAGLFAGCREFSSLRPLLETAKYVLKNVRSLILVHNRNPIVDLVTWFPTVNTVVLYHDLHWDFDNDLVIDDGPTTPCRIEQLLGNSPAMGSENLNLRTATLVNLLKRSPKLAVVMSTNMDAALSSKEVVKAASKRLPVPFRRKELFLGNTYLHHTGILLVMSAKSAEDVEKAHRHFDEVEHLDLTADSESAIGKSPPESCGERPRFEHLQRLTLRTNWDHECGLDTRSDLPSDLDSTLACLPSLRRVRSDDYNIRLHVASCFPHIALDWCVCTVCCAEFRKVDGDHNYLYKITQDVHLIRPIEVVTYSFGDKSKKDKEGGEAGVDAKEEVKKDGEEETTTKVGSYGTRTQAFKNRAGSLLGSRISNGNNWIREGYRRRSTSGN